MLQQGRWGKSQIVSRAFVQHATSPSARNRDYGMLWWIRYGRGVYAQTPGQLTALRKNGIGFASTLMPLRAQRFSSTAAYWLEAGALLNPTERQQLAALVQRQIVPFERQPGERIGFNANGWLGQYLCVYPTLSLVTVRLRRGTEGRDDLENQRFGFQQFITLSESLIAPD